MFLNKWLSTEVLTPQIFMLDQQEQSVTRAAEHIYRLGVLLLSVSKRKSGDWQAAQISEVKLKVRLRKLLARVSQ
jgi:hypothetical protein